MQPLILDLVVRYLHRYPISLLAMLRTCRAWADAVSTFLMVRSDLEIQGVTFPNVYLVGRVLKPEHCATALCRTGGLDIVNLDMSTFVRLKQLHLTCKVDVAKELVLQTPALRELYIGRAGKAWQVDIRSPVKLVHLEVPFGLEQIRGMEHQVDIVSLVVSCGENNQDIDLRAQKRLRRLSIYGVLTAGVLFHDVCQLDKFRVRQSTPIDPVIRWRVTDLHTPSSRTLDLSTFPNLRNLDVRGALPVALVGMPHLQILRIGGACLYSLNLCGVPTLRVLAIFSQRQAPFAEYDLRGLTHLHTVHTTGTQIHISHPAVAHLRIRGEWLKSVTLEAMGRTTFQIPSKCVVERLHPAPE